MLSESKILSFSEIAGAIYNDYFSPDEDDCTVNDLESSEEGKKYKRVCEAQHRADQEDFQKQKQEMYSDIVITLYMMMHSERKVDDNIKEINKLKQRWGIHCVPVNIDEVPLLTDDEIDAIADVTPVDNNALRRAICKAQIHKVVEYLQERMG